MTGRGEAFRLLGVTADATEAEVRAAFRRKVIESHPDTAVEGNDDTMVRRLIEAYHLLVDTAPRTAPDPPVTRVGERQPGVRRVDVGQARAERDQASTRPQLRCSQCRGTGSRIVVATCPTCRGDSLVTALDINQVRIARCYTCSGRGHLRSLVQCDACEGTCEDLS